MRIAYLLLRRIVLSFIAVVAAAGLASNSASVFALPADLKSGVKVQVNDDLLRFPDAEPFIDDEHRLQVPIRCVAESIGFEVSWEEKEDLFIVTLKKEEQTLELILNESYAIFNGVEMAITSPVTLVDGRVYAPIRLIADTFGILLQWDERNRLAILSLNGEYRAPAWYAPQYEVIEVNATAYSSSNAENGGWGAVDYFGNRLELGTIAVDPSIIPLGSKIYVEGYDFEHLPDGGMMGKASDVGGSVKGNRIDIFIPAPPDQVRMFGKQKVKVYVFD